MEKFEDKEHKKGSCRFSSMALCSAVEHDMELALKAQKAKIIQIGEGMKKDEANKELKCKCDGNDFCDCDFSGVCGYNQALLDYKKKIETEL